MTKPEIVAAVAQEAKITKKAAAMVLETIVKSVHASLSGEKGKMRIASLGTFKVIDINARRGVNPRTGMEMTIPAMRLPRFYPAKALKKAVSGTK